VIILSGMAVDKMRLVRLVRLDASNAIKVGIIVKDMIRDRITFKISVGAKVWAGESWGQLRYFA